MVGRPGKFQPRFTAGELDELIQQNTDLDLFNKGAASMVNVRPLPQGGFTAADGLACISRVRGVLTPITATPGGFTTPVAAWAVTTAGVTFNLTLPAGSQVSSVDLFNFGACQPGGAAPTRTAPQPPESPLIAGNVTVTANGVQLGQVLGLVDTLHTRRFANAPGVTTPATAIHINVLPNQTIAFYLSSIVVNTESGVSFDAVIKPFAYNATTTYDFVYSAGNIDVFAQSGYVASIPVILGSTLRTFKYVQKIATQIITSPLYAPILVERQGSDYEWDTAPVSFPIVPNYNFGDVVYSNSTPAIWMLTFFNFDTQLGAGTAPMPSGGVHYTLSVNGAASAAIQQAPGNPWTTAAAAIQALIETIPGVAAGVTVSQTYSVQNYTTLLVTFGGAGNEGDGWAISGLPIDKADAAITATKTQVGIAGGEPIMSSSRGWPGACGFYQQRLGLGGFASAPLTILWSETGNPYGLDTRLTAATAPMLWTLDGQADETITSLHLGRTLDIFTTYGEWWVQPTGMSATSPPTVVYSTSNGIAPSVDPIESEGTTIFVHASRGLILEYRYDYAQQNYTGNSLSTESSSVVQNIKDNALRRAIESVDTNQHLLVLDSGDAAMLSLKRDQQINAFSVLETDGEFAAVDVNARAEANFIVSRQVNGAPVFFFEKATPGLWLHCAEYFAVTAGQASISGLTDFIGATVWAIVDGYAQGPFTVPSNATIALEFATLAAGTATVGRWTAPFVETLPLPRDVGPRTVVRRPARAHTVRLSVVDTTNVAIGANGSGPYECPLYRFGGLADTPPSAQPYTGWTFLEGIPGFQDDVQVVITQLRPGALTVTGVTIEADL